MVRLAVLGDPVRHSLSPVIHGAALRYAGINGEYVARRVNAEGMRKAIADLRSGRLTGANVTMPHKALAARLAARCSETVIRSGGANTLWLEDNEVQAHSTDPDGVRFAWQRALLPKGSPVLLLGAGAAAAAAMVALEGRDIAVSARRTEAAHQLVAQTGVPAQVRTWGHSVTDAVVVNATPIGMNGESLPSGVLERASGLLEMAYGHKPTPATIQMEARSLPVAPGELMLVGQALASFAIWTGVEPPPEVMLEALATR